jgi:3-oxoacyl-[acyl-carrier-protein] synthase II
MRRVVVTGLGAVTPLGTGVRSFWDGITNGQSGLGPMTLVDAEPLTSKVAGECGDFDATGLLGGKAVRRMDRSVQMGIVAAAEAWEDSGIEGHLDRDETGVAFASGVGGIGSLLQGEHIRQEKGPDRVSPFTVPALMLNATAGHVSMRYGLRGPNFCTATACASGNHALGLAMQMIRHGEAEAMIAGGTESAFVPVTVAAFAQMTALSTHHNDRPQEASRPFDTGRDGFVIGEGAGALILEEREAAIRRGAKIYGELVGFGQSADAHHLTLPADDGGGAALAMRRALKTAGIGPDAIGYVNAHGTSTPQGDIAETKAIRKAFGEFADRLQVSSTKSMFGHLIGAAGAVEGVASVLALHDGILPPTINLVDQDPQCDLDYIPNEARKTEVEYALSNGFGFGGHNAAVVFRRHRDN